MTRELRGELGGAGVRAAIVVSRFNEFITERLLSGALGALGAHGVATDDVVVAWTPGAFELPLAAQTFAESDGIDVVIALGCVIRGATPHFDYVCAQAAAGIASVGLKSGKPVIFGVLTTDTLEQAIERAGAKAGNKGSDAACAALESLSLLRQIRAQAAG